MKRFWGKWGVGFLLGCLVTGSGLLKGPAEAREARLSKEEQKADRRERFQDRRTYSEDRRLGFQDRRSLFEDRRKEPKSRRDGADAPRKIQSGDKTDKTPSKSSK